jgi:8-amino-7-oxononanoate synthase
VGDDPLGWLELAAARREADGLRRHLRHRGSDERLIDLASNDYLGLARDPRVVDGAVRAAREWGAGSTGSRLVTGSTMLHAELEGELARFCGAPAGLVFSSGYTANLGVVSALGGRDALVVSDRSCHASLVDACRLSRSTVEIAPRNDPSAVDALLAARTERRALVVIDSVSSVDGELAPLRELHAVCRARGAVLVADEAHGLGVRGPGGRGLVAEVGLAGEPDVIVTVTLSKALGAQGGAVLAGQPVIDHLVDSARTFIFDTGLAPACAGGALAALRVLRGAPWLPAQVLACAAVLADAAGVQAPPSAVVSVVLGEPQVALAAAQKCLAAGVRVGCFRPPSVPTGTSRLRITGRAGLDPADLRAACEVLAEVLAEVPDPAKGPW